MNASRLLVVAAVTPPGWVCWYARSSFTTLPLRGYNEPELVEVGSNKREFGLVECGNA
jgi:hypothetical protein